MKAPAASFVPMVDATLCAVCILILLIVVLPRSQNPVSHRPQADVVISCQAQTPLDFIVTAVPAAAPERKTNTQVSVMMSDAAAVSAVRRLIAVHLQGMTIPSARIVVVPGARNHHCRDVIVCAFARIAGTCPLKQGQTGPFWQDVPGQAFPIVTYRYGDMEPAG